MYFENLSLYEEAGTLWTSIPRRKRVRWLDMVRIKVRELVEERGLTWREFGESTGFSKQTVHALMTGRLTRLDLRTLDTLCRYFGVPLSDVIVFEDDDNLAMVDENS